MYTKVKKFCQSLRELQLRQLILKTKSKTKLLTSEQQESSENAKICYICKEKFEVKCSKHKKYSKVKDHCHYTGEYRGVPIAYVI